MYPSKNYDEQFFQLKIKFLEKIKDFMYKYRWVLYVMEMRVFTILSI